MKEIISIHSTTVELQPNGIRSSVCESIIIARFPLQDVKLCICVVGFPFVFWHFAIKCCVICDTVVAF